ncbi:hypothetical protein ASE80_15010 [Pseudomonas sp. Leaf15]|uniref:dermonecrotic toxin domain-containing protein n=1 Tax=unclassified Pseudomonas TaxID=196821 RepID=UPI000702A8F4|nr:MULTISPECIES: NEL-type E3 ubiquitin ligase domain-containing protein [unclassified Pseudomonas]KQM46793.1 hypothetical protein ASE80_15010 [Pseudomonas sp. Leaf15]RAH02392.1 hypothetical protein DJ480_11670 [Pseudomonas sp. Leaf98]
MTEPDVTPPAPDTLSAYIEEQQAQGPLMSGAEWSMTRVLMPLRKTLERFYGCLDVQQQQDYVRLQKACIRAQSTFEAAIDQLGAELEATSLSTLTAALKKLAGKEVDPKVARIHTRYVKPADTSTPNDPALRVPRAADDRVDSPGLSGVTLWEAACMNYSGLSGWGFPGHVSLEEASYLDSNVGISAADFIDLVRDLDLGTLLRKRLDSALQSSTRLGAQVMALATAELEFALIEALRNTDRSRVDREKYQAVVSALSDESLWGVTQEVKMFIPHGPDNTNGTERYGLLGVYTDLPRGDYLSIPYVTFSVKDCKGVFSYFPDRPGGALRHYDKFSEASKEFYVGFKALHTRKEMGWLYQSMSLPDYARLSARSAKERMPEGLDAFARFLYRLFGRASELTQVDHIGYKPESVYNAPTVSLYRFYIERCRANLKVLAHETPGIMATLLEFSQTLFGEIISLLLIPVPGPLKGLGRLRAFAMFTSIGQTLFQGLHKDGRGDLVQAAMDVADLLSSRFLHARLAPTVRRRHQALYERLAQQSKPLTAAERESQTDGQLLEKMLGATDVPPQKLERIVTLSNSSRADLDQVWEGAPPSASLVEAVHRFNIDQLIDWAAEGADAKRPEAMGAVEILAPLLTQHKDWPKNTALSIQNPQGVEVRRYSKRADHKTTAVVTVTALEGDLFAHSTPRRITLSLPQAIVDLLPEVFLSGESTLAEQLAGRADALRIDLFEALTEYANASRATAPTVSQAVLRLLPDSVADHNPAHAVIEQLHTLHPLLSRARLLEVLRQHPLSEHQQTQLLHSQFQPQALYTALRSARQRARAEAMVDGVLHPRRFSQKTQDWATEFAAGALRDLTGQVVVVSPQAQAIPYVSRGPLDKTIVVIDHGRGQFSLFDAQSPSPRATETDDLYQTVVSQISEHDLLRLKWDAQSAASQFRHAVARTLLNNLRPDGRFYPSRREIGRYASVVETSNIVPEPDALGLYSLGADRYLFIEGEYFNVAQERGLGPWRIQHPSLELAYAPVLTHNGEGAWRHEWENPLTWDGQKPFQRLGPWVRELTPDAIVQIQHISGVTPAILRRVHVRNERPPAILRETVERFTIHQRVKSGVEVGRDFYDELLGEVGPEAADALAGVTGASRADQVALLESRVGEDKPQMERLFFKALCHKSEQSSEPLAQVLQRDFPSLTAAIAEDLVRDATATEQASLEAGRVPLTLTPAVRWWIDYLQKTRALEGVHLSAATSDNSSKLILHTLPDIDGWPKHLRVEVRERGRLIDSIGPADGTLTRELESLDGQYQAYTPQPDGDRKALGRPGVFLEVLLGALPTIERQAVGYTHAGGFEELIQEIGHRLERKWEFADTLLGIGQRPWYNPPRRVADGRIGYPLSGGEDLGAEDHAQVLRVRVLFPRKDDKEVFEIINNLAGPLGDRDQVINSLFDDWEALDGVLDRWTAQDEQVEQKAARSEAAERIRSCWRKEDSTRGVSFELNLEELALEDLPLMSAYFRGVKILSLKGNQLTGMPANFFRGFPDLRWLTLDGNKLEHLPSGLDELPNLSLLNLANNRIKPNLQDVMALAGLTRLIKLDLSGNPLAQGSPLKLYPLKNLEVLKLRHSGLTQLPSGAVTLRSLRVFDVIDNQLRELGEHDLYVNENVHRALDVRGNDLSQDTYELLTSYRLRPGYYHVDFGLSADHPLPKPFIDRWLPPLPYSEFPQRRNTWSSLSAEQMADRFFNVLWNISAYRPFTEPGHRELRIDITRRVWGIIDSAVNNVELRQVLFDAPLADRMGGIDGLLLCINDLELQMHPIQLLAEKKHSAGPDLVNYYRARHRLASIYEKVLRALSEFSRPTMRELCRHVFDYRMALAQTLGLPLPFHQRFDVPAVLPRPFAPNTLRNLIIAQEHQIDWPGVLKDEEHWISFLELKYPSRFEAALGHYYRRMERANRYVNDGDINEHRFEITLRAIKVPMGAAKRTVVQQLTQIEWASFLAN